MLAEGHELARKPGTTSHEEAAAVPLSALTAWQALFTHAALEARQSVLELGAAGGVGTMAVQLARWNGTRVVSEGKVDFVKSLGAHEVIDYQKSRVDGKFEVVLDCVGRETQEGGWERVKGGILVSGRTSEGREKKAIPWHQIPFSLQLSRMEHSWRELQKRLRRARLSQWSIEFFLLKKEKQLSSSWRMGAPVGRLSSTFHA